jgi:hypothetical protein
VQRRGRVGEGEDVGDPLGDEAGSTGSGPLGDGWLDRAGGRWRGKESVDGVNAVGRSGRDQRGKGTNDKQ